MDHGTLTDNNGRKADFRNIIIVMTTNAGADALNRPVMGFTAKKEQGDESAEIKRLFSPEFRNRLDATISFKSLDHDIILRVVDKFLMQLEAQLPREKGRCGVHRRPARAPRQARLRSADGCAPDVEAHSGHHPPRARRRAALRQARQRRKVTVDIEAEKITLKFVEEKVPEVAPET